MKELHSKKIKSIPELILALNSCEIAQTENCYLNTMRSVDITFVEWEKFFKFNEEKPKRIRLSKTEDYELLISCWEKGQEGPIHDIDTAEAWIHPICGKFIEERYKLSHNKLEQVSSVLLNTQSYSYMQKSKTIYKYINDYEARSVCLHLYAKPVKIWREYDRESAKTTIVAYDSDKVLNTQKQQ
tara:strand:- start:342 stop:896 length:555 start_codon:yes stop_codon:yes gene_type:complete